MRTNYIVNEYLAFNRQCERDGVAMDSETYDKLYAKWLKRVDGEDCRNEI